jgi:hypothetical protein
LISLIKDWYSKRKRRRQKKERMEIKAKRALSVAFLVLMLIALALPASPCGATTTSLLMKNGSNNHCNGRTNECLIAEDYVDLGFMMDSGMSRMLAEEPIYLAKVLALIASKPAVPVGAQAARILAAKLGLRILS